MPVDWIILLIMCVISLMPLSICAGLALLICVKLLDFYGNISIIMIVGLRMRPDFTMAFVLHNIQQYSCYDSITINERR